MKNPYKPFFQVVLTDYAKSFRKKNGYTQEDMAELLGIDVRSYSDLDHGIYCFSAVTLILLLLVLTDEELRTLFKQLRERLWTLDELDLEIVTMLVMEGCKRTENARYLGVTCSAVTQRIQKIRKNLNVMKLLETYLVIHRTRPCVSGATMSSAPRSIGSDQVESGWAMTVTWIIAFRSG